MATDTNTAQTGFYSRLETVNRRGCILWVDDELRYRKSWREFFTRNGWDVHAYANGEEANEVLDDDGWETIDIAVLDFDLGRSNATGIEYAQTVKEKGSGRIQSVVLTAQIQNIPQQDMFREGSGDRLCHIFEKDDDDKQSIVDKLEMLQGTADACRELAQLRNHVLKDAEQGIGGRRNLDPAIVSRIADIRTIIAPSLLPVLILGETGTGKEMIAAEIHEHSGLRQDGSDNFRVVNCGGLSDNLLLSELFGHVKGAFTDAKTHKLGVVLEAAGIRVEKQMKDTDKVDYLAWLKSHCSPTTEPKKERNEDRVLSFKELGGYDTAWFSGTLFLDEVADLSGPAQNALLRFLDGNGFVPVGYSGNPLAPRVRIVAATNRVDELLRETRSSRRGDSDGIIQGFRSDLLWRLMKWVVWLPSLHERDVKDPLLIVKTHAESFGKRDNVPGNLRGLSFIFPDEANQLLQNMIKEKRFSGTEPLRTGNVRNLLGLVDRACWLAMKESGIYPNETSQPIAERTIEITAKILRLAAKNVLELEELWSNETPSEENPVDVEGSSGTDGIRLMASTPLDESSSRGSGNPAQVPSEETASVNEEPTHASEPDSLALESLKKLYKTLTECPQWHPKDFPVDDQSDAMFLDELTAFFSSEGHKAVEQDFKTWIERPDQAFKEGQSLDEDGNLRRWRYLFMLASVAAASTVLNAKKSPNERRTTPGAKDVQGLFRVGGERDAFRSILLPDAFRPFKVDVKLDDAPEKARSRRPVRDLIWFLTAPAKLEKNRPAITVFEYDEDDEDVCKFIKHIRDLARKVQLK